MDWISSGNPFTTYLRPQTPGKDGPQHQTRTRLNPLFFLEGIMIIAADLFWEKNLLSKCRCKYSGLPPRNLQLIIHTTTYFWGQSAALQYAPRISKTPIHDINPVRRKLVSCALLDRSAMEPEDD